MMYSRSVFSSEDSTPGLSALSSASGARKAVPSVRITDRSIKFSSSRTLPDPIPTDQGIHGLGGDGLNDTIHPGREFSEQSIAPEREYPRASHAGRVHEWEKTFKR